MKKQRWVNKKGPRLPLAEAIALPMSPLKDLPRIWKGRGWVPKDAPLLRDDVQKNSFPWMHHWGFHFPGPESETYPCHCLFWLLNISFAAVHLSTKQSHVQSLPSLREVGVLSGLDSLLTLRPIRTHHIQLECDPHKHRIICVWLVRGCKCQLT